MSAMSPLSVDRKVKQDYLYNLWLIHKANSKSRKLLSTYEPPLSTVYIFLMIIP